MRRALVSGMFLAMVLAGTAAVAPTAAGIDEAPSRKAKLYEQLGETYKVYQKWQATDENSQPEEFNKLRMQFQSGLQKIAGDLASITPEQGAPKKYKKLTMNAGKKSLDAFRFKTPAGKTNWDLDWEFVTPVETVGGWYIVPREGTMEGFKFFRRAENHQEKGVDLPKENLRFVQSLPDGILQPASEYIIWFVFKKNEPTDLFIRMGLTETKKE